MITHLAGLGFTVLDENNKAKGQAILVGLQWANGIKVSSADKVEIEPNSRFLTVHMQGSHES